MVDSSIYYGLKDEDREDVIAKIYSYSSAKAKKIGFRSTPYKMGDYNKKVDFAYETYSISPTQYILCKEIMDKDGNESITQKEAYEAIKRMPLSNKQKAAMWALQNSLWKPANNPFIKGFVTNYSGDE